MEIDFTYDPSPSEDELARYTATIRTFAKDSDTEFTITMRSDEDEMSYDEFQAMVYRDALESVLMATGDELDVYEEDLDEFIIFEGELDSEGNILLLGFHIEDNSSEDD